jgi:hypothetical protein
MTTQEEFFQANAVDGVLPDALMGEFLNLLPGGDTSGKPPAAQADAASDPDANADDEEGEGKDGKGKPPADGAKPNEDELNATNAVIMSKDGKHTIEYGKLEEARTQAREAAAATALAEAKALQLEQELTALKAGTTGQPAAKVDTTKQSAGEIDPEKLMEGVDFGDYSDKSIAKAVAQMQARLAAPLLEQIAQLQAGQNEQNERTQKSVAQSHYEAIYAAHADADSIPESREFAQWQESLPKFQREAIARTLAEGETQDVIDVFTTYKKSATGTTGAEATGTDAKANATKAAEAAAKAIAQATSKPPASLSDLPGNTAHHDEAGAMLDMSAEKALRSFEGKDPAAIMATLNRVL